MEISYHAPGIDLNQRTSKILVDSLARALRPHQDHVQEVSVHLRDLNAHKGGVDKQCKVTARVKGLQKAVVVTETSADMAAAIRQAVRALEESLRRTVEKRRATRRPRKSP